MNFEESKTKKNLETALQGEALAHLKYQFYKSKLVDYSKGYENVLDEIIHNEKEHGKLWFKLLHGGEVPSDEENLVDAIKGETYESTEMYLNFGEVAEEEGFDDIAKLFYEVAMIEGTHAHKFKDIKKGYGGEYSSILPKKWKCLNCGYELIGENAPLECPVCKHPQKYFIKE